MSVMKASDLLKAADTHANRPAANAVPTGALYSCTTHNLIYRSDGATWATWATLSGGGGTGQGLSDFARAKRTSGDLTFSATGSFASVDTSLDLVMNASIGDVIEARMAMRVIGSNYFVADFHTLVGGSPVNSMSADGSVGGSVPSFPGWGAGIVPSSPGIMLNGSKRYTLVAGDISTGTVTLRLRARAGANQTISASDPILYVEATNLGQQL